MNKLIHLLKKPKVLLPCLMLVTLVTPVHAFAPLVVIPLLPIVAEWTAVTSTVVAGTVAAKMITSDAHDARTFKDEYYWEKQKDINQVSINENNANQYKKYFNSFKDNDRAKTMYDTLADITIDVDELAFPYTLEPVDALGKIYSKSQTINEDELIIGPNENSKQFIEYYAKLITASVATYYLVIKKPNFEFTELNQKIAEKSKEVLAHVLNTKMTFGLNLTNALGGRSTHYYRNTSYLQMIKSVTNCVDINTFSDTIHACGYKLTQHSIYDEDNSNYDLPKYLSRLIDKTVRNYNFDQYLIGEASDTVSTGGSSGGDDPGENNIPTTIDTDQSSNCTKVRLMPKMFFLNGRLYIPTPDYIRNKEEVSRWANTNGGNIILPQGFDQDNPTTHPNKIEITGFVRGGGGFCCTTQDSSRGRPDEEPYNRVVIYTNGDIYSGQWANDNRNGNGIMTYANGDVYDGTWANGRPYGHGVMTYANGDVYDGHFPYGHGVMTYANGDVYDGTWLNGRRNGNGVMTYANGESYEGKWTNGNPANGI
jgi:hypothetical protein